MNKEAAVFLRGVTFSYPDGTTALREVDLTLYKGMCTAIIGANGSGKSTLLSLLNGINLPQTGYVNVLGRRVTKSNLREVRSLVGLVFQDPDTQLFCPTVKDDIAFGLINMGIHKEEISKRISEVLEFIGLKGTENRPPFHLSEGEKKLASLATVLAMKPEILALDEPTAGLDPFHRNRLMQILKKLKNTLIIATHDLDFALDISQRVILLFEGKIKAEGETKEILYNRNLLVKYKLDLPLCLKKDNCN